MFSVPFAPLSCACAIKTVYRRRRPKGAEELDDEWDAEFGSDSYIDSDNEEEEEEEEESNENLIRELFGSDLEVLALFWDVCIVLYVKLKF